MKEGDGEKGRGWEGGRERENHLPSLQHDRKVTKIKYTKKSYLNKTNQQKKKRRKRDQSRDLLQEARRHEEVSPEEEKEGKQREKRHE